MYVKVSLYNIDEIESVETVETLSYAAANELYSDLKKRLEKHNKSIEEIVDER